MSWRDQYDFGWTVQGFVYPRDEQGVLPANSEPNMWYEYRFNKNLGQQQAIRVLIIELQQHLRDLERMDIE